MMTVILGDIVLAFLSPSAVLSTLHVFIPPVLTMDPVKWVLFLASILPMGRLRHRGVCDLHRVT
jgi:hypothetical protein